MHRIANTIVLALLAVAVAAPCAAAPATSPFAGSYSGRIATWDATLSIDDRGSIAGAASPSSSGFCSKATISGRVTDGGSIRLVLRYTCIDFSRRFLGDTRVRWIIEGTASLDAEGNLDVDSSDPLAGSFTLDAR